MTTVTPAARNLSASSYASNACAVIVETATRSNPRLGTVSLSISSTSWYETSMSLGVSAASVSRERLGSDAITSERSTKPGSVSPSFMSSSSRTRTPLIAMNPILTAHPLGAWRPRRRCT